MFWFFFFWRPHWKTIFVAVQNVQCRVAFSCFADYPPRCQMDKHICIFLTMGHLTAKSNRLDIYYSLKTSSEVKDSRYKCYVLYESIHVEWQKRQTYRCKNMGYYLVGPRKEEEWGVTAERYSSSLGDNRIVLKSDNGNDGSVPCPHLVYSMSRL